MTQYWNWSWVNILKETNKSSLSVNQSNGTLPSFRTAVRGQIKAIDLNTSINAINTNINHYWRIWNNSIRPILDSLPAGPRDTRWRTGKGLPPKIDALNYGVQGTTLFVFNDADEVKASGRYWSEEDERPITIAEAFENLWRAFYDLDTSTTITPETVDLSALWYAIGNRYNGGTSASTSLDARTSVLESNINQLRNDIYGADEGYTPWNFGVPLSYSIAQNIDYLLRIHNVTEGWQADPSNVNHDGLGVEDHQHPYTDILPMPDISLTQGRFAPYTTLYNDILRLRYEVCRTRGSFNWYQDVTDPVTATYGNLGNHINYVGSITPIATNPHGISYEDTGADSIFNNIIRFIGMIDYTSITEMPFYSSTNFVTQNVNLTVAISELDEAITNALSGFVTRVEYGPYDRSGLSETERSQTPIIIEHNRSEHPVIQVLDLSPDLQESFGMYSSPTTDYVIDYPDNNTIRVWTNAEIVTVIALFGGGVGLGEGGSTTNDHGSLTGLSDDDHPQYFLASGSRAMSGNINLAGNVLLTTSGSLDFSDNYNSGSSWSQTYIELASSSSEWSTFRTNFGEVSLMSAINTAYAGGGGGSGVTSLNTLTGALTINNSDGNISITTVDPNITIGLVDVPQSLVSGLTDNQVLFADGSGNIDQSTYLTFNDNNQLKVGSGTPGHLSTTAYSLYVGGRLEVDGYSYFDNITYFSQPLTAQSNYISFADGYVAASDWTDSYIPLFNSSAEWSAAYALLGDTTGSLWALINAAITGAGTFTEHYVLFGAADGSITEDSGIAYYVSTGNLSLSTGSFRVATSTEGLKMSSTSSSDELRIQNEYGSYHDSYIKLYGDATIDIEAVDITAETGSAEINLTARESASTTSPQINILSGGSYSGTLAGTLTLQAYDIDIEAAVSVDFTDSWIDNIAHASFSDEQTLTSSSGVISSFLWTNGPVYIPVTENITSITFGVASGCFRVSMRLAFSGSYSVTGFPGTIKWAGASPPITGTSGDEYFVTLEYRTGSSSYYGVISGPF